MIMVRKNERDPMLTKIEEEGLFDRKVDGPAAKRMFAKAKAESEKPQYRGGEWVAAANRVTVSRGAKWTYREHLEDQVTFPSALPD